LFVHAASALLCESSLKLGGVGINDSEDRRIKSEPICTICDHGSYVKA
jgi:hypothetical protein